MAKTTYSPTRRREARKGLARDQQSWPRRFSERRLWWTIGYIAFFTLFASLIHWVAERSVPYHVGQTLDDAVVAREEFTYENDALTRQKREQAANSVYPVYVTNQPLIDRVRSRLVTVGEIALANRGKTWEQLSEADQRKLSMTPEEFESLKFEVGVDDGKGWQEKIKRYVEQIASLPVLPNDRFEVELNQHQAIELRIAGRATEIVEQARWMRADDARDDIQQIAERVFSDTGPFDHYATSLVTDRLSSTCLYDEPLTQQARENARNSVQPQLETIRKGEVVAEAGTQITTELLQRLEAENAAYRDSLGLTQQWLGRVGLAGLILAISAGLWFYIYTYNPRIIENPWRGSAITIVLLVALAVSLFGVSLTPPYLFYAFAVGPVLFAAILLSIVYDQRFALAAGAIHALLIAASIDQPIAVFVIMLTGVAVAVRQLPDVRTRSKIAWVGVWTAGALALMVLLFGLLRSTQTPGYNISSVLIDMLVVALTSMGVGALIQTLLPGIERVFQVTTSMTLKELNDASLPLLRRLVERAPGTYQHSLRLADLAEAAAEAIGANSLLCKVGAMYHDIGKINKPDYFIENQGRGMNRHDKLSPAMSLLIIVGHVKDGLEMAREEGLPRVIRHFIESHHGTTLVEYFYNQARKQSEEEETPAPTEFEYRYPGPKPQTREAAILMLCDGIESAGRALAEPTPIRLEQLVHRMAQKRLMDGQFDECNITLRELHLIELAIHKTLCAIYHARIAYPGDKKEAPKTGDTQSAKAGSSQSATGDASRTA